MEGTMNKILVAIMAGAALLVGGAGLASAQDPEVDPVVTVDKEEVEPGGEVVVNVSGAEADSPIAVEIGEATAEGTADGDGNADIPVTIPENVEVGQLDGIVNVNGVDVPISVLVAALGGEGAGGGDGDGGDGGDGTPAPTAVNTGDELRSSSNAAALFAAAAGLFLVGAGAIVFRRRSVES
jgi:hypothetical protein